MTKLSIHSLVEKGDLTSMYEDD